MRHSGYEGLSFNPIRFDADLFAAKNSSAHPGEWVQQCMAPYPVLVLSDNAGYPFSGKPEPPMNGKSHISPKG